jgi:energy-coupling factor transport system permease protein
VLRIAESASPNLPRLLHPVAWWVWAIGLAVAVNRTTNPLLLAIALGVLSFVVASRRLEAPWARAFKYYLALAGVAIVIRVVFRGLFSGPVNRGDHVWLHLPTFAPDWYSGVRLGGPVTAEAMVAAAADGLRLGAILCCLGAVNVLTNPKRALRALPGALHELGVAVVVALSVAPQLVQSTQRVRRARRLRAGNTRGFRALRGIVIPVLEDALERSLRLAAAMDSRGFGRGTSDQRTRRTAAVLLLIGLLGLCLGTYGLLDDTTSWWLGAPTLAGAAVVSAAGLAVTGRRVHVTRYRPDPWRTPEWLVAGSGVACATLMYLDTDGLDLSVSPLTWPSLPLLPVIAFLVAATAGLTAPVPPRPDVAVRRPVTRREVAA